MRVGSGLDAECLKSVNPITDVLCGYVAKHVAASRLSVYGFFQAVAQVNFRLLIYLQQIDFLNHAQCHEVGRSVCSWFMDIMRIFMI